MHFVDLTHPFTSTMPAYPDDPASSLTERLNVENDGYADHTLTTTMHVGTHIDAPEHMIAGGR